MAPKDEKETKRKKKDGKKQGKGKKGRQRLIRNSLHLLAPREGVGVEGESVIIHGNGGANKRHEGRHDDHCYSPLLPRALTRKGDRIMVCGLWVVDWLWAPF